MESFVRSTNEGKSVYRCRCLRCGKYFETLADNVVQKRIVSCGCYHDDKAVNSALILKTKSDSANFDTNILNINSKKVYKSNKTVGVRGVCFIKSVGLYKAYIGFQKKRYVLKYSSDVEDCIKARKEAEARLYDNFLEWYEAYCKSNDDVADEKQGK